MPSLQALQRTCKTEQGTRLQQTRERVVWANGSLPLPKIHQKKIIIWTI